MKYIKIRYLREEFWKISWKNKERKEKFCDNRVGSKYRVINNWGCNIK